MRIYTVHLRRPADALSIEDRDLVLIKEGFCWPAFFLSLLWALRHRLWWGVLGLIAINVIGAVVVFGAGLGPAGEGLISLGIAVIIGQTANDLRRWTLGRSGFGALGVVIAESRLAAERRFLEGNPGLTALLSATPPPPPASPAMPSPAMPSPVTP